jgi:hypothetical protein
VSSTALLTSVGVGATDLDGSEVAEHALELSGTEFGGPLEGGGVIQAELVLLVARVRHIVVLTIYGRSDSQVIALYDDILCRGSGALLTHTQLELQVLAVAQTLVAEVTSCKSATKYTIYIYRYHTFTKHKQQQLSGEYLN